MCDCSTQQCVAEQKGPPLRASVPRQGRSKESYFTDPQRSERPELILFVVNRQHSTLHIIACVVNRKHKRMHAYAHSCDAETDVRIISSSEA